MADRRNYYHKQTVTESELDEGFALLEQADWNFAADVGVTGIISGATPVQHDPTPNLSVDLDGPARGYDGLGRRIFVGTDQNVDCSVDLDGVPTQVQTIGNERYLSCFARFDRNLQDERTDGNSQQIFYIQDEAFEIVVRQAPEAASGNGTRVALLDDELLLFDVLLPYGKTQILDADILIDRRQQWVFTAAEHIEISSGAWANVSPAEETVQAALDALDALFTFPGQAGSPNALGAGTLNATLSALLAHLNDHENAATGAHAASAIAFTPAGNIAATDVQAALAEEMTDLAATSGATLIGGAAHTGPNGNYNLTADTLDAQLVQLLTHIDSYRAYLQSQGSGAGTAMIGLANAIGGSPHALPESNLHTALTSLLGWLNAHESSAAGAHAASAISLSPYSWIAATQVQAAIQEIVDDLANASGGDAGTWKIGSQALSGSAAGGTPPATTEVTAGQLVGQIAEILGHIHKHRFYQGDSADHDGKYARQVVSDTHTIGAGTDWAGAYSDLETGMPPIVQALYYDTGGGRWHPLHTGPRAGDVTIDWSISGSPSTWILHLANGSGTSIDVKTIGFQVTVGT